MHTNRLIDEKSPYLLQHAHNPVDWYAWGEEAFNKARSEDKPIFLSIGYSTCHWCHVMERESFENDSVAELLNRHFVPVKLDREERPDVDRVYMTFVQATTGSGGWPMSVFLTPDLKPFFGGTYFPPDNRYGRPGFRTVLEYLANAWLSDRPKIIQSGVDVLQELKKQAEWKPGSNFLDDTMAESCFNVFRRTYDSQLGGFGSAPKFPRPVAFEFLLRYFRKSGNEEARDMTIHTLQEMAKGGMHDQLGGGFHRYSVDERWFVPHFEKMLYDQAQLAISYIEAWQLTHEGGLMVTARDIFEYVLRDMTHPDGGFYSAEDADSVIDPANPHEKGEGAFYIWSQEEIEQVLGQPQARWFNYRYGVHPRGNVQNDPHNEFTGKNILYEAHTIEEAAEHFGVSETDMRLAAVVARDLLLEERAKRVRPHLDDKILTGWNGLMISAFALGAQAFGEKRYEQAARRAADFVLTRMRHPQLLRRFRDGEAAIPAFLDDYAFFANGLVDLYEATFDARYLSEALAVTEQMLARFEDAEHGGFYSAAQGADDLVLRMKDDYDGAEPAGNSVAAILLLRLAEFTGREDLRAAAERTLKAFSDRLRVAPHATPLLVSAYLFSRSSPKQIVLAGSADAGDFEALKAEAGRHFVAHRVLLKADAAVLPKTAAMTEVDGQAAAYVCENFTCRLPVTAPGELARLLES